MRRPRRQSVLPLFWSISYAAQMPGDHDNLSSATAGDVANALALALALR